MGRPRKPTKLKLIQGTYRPDRARNEPQPKPIAPPRPRNLSRQARSLWNRLAPALEKLGLLTEIDGPLFEALCETWSRSQAAQCRLRQVLKRKGVLNDLNVIRRAELSVEKATALFRLIASDFGLSPAARARLDVDVSKEIDEMDQFLDQR